MKVKAISESRVLRPVGDLDLEEGEEVELEIKKNIVKRTYGLIKLDAEAIDEIIEDTKYGSQNSAIDTGGLKGRLRAFVSLW